MRKGLRKLAGTAVLAFAAAGCTMETNVNVDVDVTLEVDCSSNGKKVVFKGDEVRITDDRFEIYKDKALVGKSDPGMNCNVSAMATSTVKGP